MTTLHSAVRAGRYPLRPKYRAPRFSLGAWITGVVLATLLCALFATVGLVESFAKRHAERAAAAQLTQFAWNMRDALDRGMSQNLEQLRSLASLSMLRESGKADAARAMLEEVKRGATPWAWIGLVGVDGRVEASTQRLLEGMEVSARPWFKGAQGGTWVGDVHAAKMLAPLLPAQAEPWRFVDIAVPVLDLQGHRRGTLGAHLSWQWAADVRRELLEPALRDQRAEVLVVSRDGLVLLGPKSLEGRTVRLPTANDGEEPARLLVDLEAESRAAATVVPDRFGRRHINGQAMFAVCSSTRGSGRFAGLGWTVVVRQPESVALADFAGLRNEILAVGGVVFAACCVVAAVISRRLTRPLRRMARAAQADMPRIDLRRVGVYQEAHLLAVALNDMVRRQRGHARQLAAINESLERRIEARTRDLELLARVDTLTGLPNRLHFNERLPEALARGRRAGLGLAVLFVDVDHFKQVNDRFGHATGDALLKTFAFRLKEGVRETDTVARLAGDEFVLILEGLHDDGEASAMAAQVLRGVCKPAVCNGETVEMSASVGVAWCADCRTDSDEILARADQALYQSKEAGRATFRLLPARDVVRSGAPA